MVKAAAAAAVGKVAVVAHGDKAVAVAGISDERWGQIVTAFIVRANDVSAAELDAHCKSSSLADFKRPRDYVFLKQIPKSPVGKILRRLLVSGKFELA